MKILDTVMWKAFAPFAKKFTYSASRLGLGILAGWLLKQALLSPDDVTSFVDVLAPIVGALVWTAIETHKDLVLNNTLAAMPETTVAHAQRVMDAGNGPSAFIPRDKAPELKE